MRADRRAAGPAPAPPGEDRLVPPPAVSYRPLLTRASGPLPHTPSGPTTWLAAGRCAAPRAPRTSNRLRLSRSHAARNLLRQIGAYRAVRGRRTVTICNETPPGR